MHTAALVLGIVSLVIAVGGGAAGMGWIGSLCGILAIILEHDMGKPVCIL